MENVSTEADDIQALRALGAAIRAIRKERGVSQEELSYLCKIDRSHMGRIERGERNVAFRNIMRIARGLTCPPSEIFRRAGL